MAIWQYTCIQKVLEVWLKKKTKNGKVAHILCFVEESVLDGWDSVQQLQYRSF